MSWIGSILRPDDRPLSPNFWPSDHRDPNGDARSALLRHRRPWGREARPSLSHILGLGVLRLRARDHPRAKTTPTPELRALWRHLYETEPPLYNRRFLES